MKANYSTSLGISTLFCFYKNNQVPLQELKKLEDIFEQTGEVNGTKLWTPKIAKTENEIRVHNLIIMEWIWNFRDHFLIYAVKQLGMKIDDAKRVAKETVKRSLALQICRYFRTQQNHGEVDDYRDYPQFEAKPPKLGLVRVDSLASNGDTVIESNLVGAEELAASTPMRFMQTVAIENLSEERDTRRVAEEAAWDWIDLLRESGLNLSVERPEWFPADDVIDTMVIGDTPKARARMELQRAFEQAKKQLGFPIRRRV